jgi:ribosomal protein S18 acetylase RimI-like enzyme
MDTIEIRKATLEDVKDLARVHVDSWFSTYCRLLPIEFLKENSHKENWEKVWIDALENTDPLKLIELVFKNGKAVGYIGCGKPFTKELRDICDLEIHGLYLLKFAQKQGLGKQLLNRAIAHAKSHNLKKIGLWVFADNPAVEFYQKLGGQKLDLEVSIEIESLHYTKLFFVWNV